MNVVYTHGLGGTPRAQPELESVLAPRGHHLERIALPHHHDPAATVAMLATFTFGDLCRLLDETAEALVRRARRWAPADYAVIGDSLGGFVSLVAAQRDPRISHCILLACSGDICDAVMNLDRLLPGLGTMAGALNPAANGGLRAQAARAMAGRSEFQREFERIDPFRPGRRERMRRLLLLGDRGDPVMRESAGRRFAGGVPGARVIMVYDEGRHHPIGRDALERYAVPFLEDRPLTRRDRVQALWARLGRGSRPRRGIAAADAPC